MKTKIAAFALAALLAGVAGGYAAGRWLTPGTDPSAAPAERKPLYYRHPMNPEVTSPVPAKDNMGMDYVPVYADDTASADEVAGTVKIDPVTIQNIGVRTAMAENRTLSADVFTVGRVDYNEEKLTRLHPKIQGWIDTLYVEQTGMTVRKGTPLLDIYSQELVVSQEEYLLALQNVATLGQSPYPEVRQGAEQLAASARERLLLLDVTASQLRDLEKTRQVKRDLHIASPFDGIVVQVGARDGMFVTPGTELYQIADLSSVWVYLDVYEHEMPWVALGDTAEIRLAGLPERTWTGQVEFIYPYLDQTTRTQKVRLAFANPDGALKPGMFGDVTIRTRRQVDAVVIPAEAVIRSGRREQVFVKRAPGKFEPRPVTLGVISEGMVQVREGLAVGEEVVVSGQFLIDSESKLREASSKMVEPENHAPAHNHGG